MKSWEEELKEEGLVDQESSFAWMDERDAELQARVQKMDEASNTKKARADKSYYTSARGLMTSLSVQMKATCKRKNLDNPSWSNDVNSLRDWIQGQNNFEFLFNRWTQSGNLKIFKPTIQRIDSNKGFEFDNMKIVASGDREYEKSR